jgi:hypothetical protein
MGEVDAGRLRASDPHGSARRAPTEVPRGLRGSEAYRRRGIEGEEQTHRRRSSGRILVLHGSGL